MRLLSLLFAVPLLTPISALSACLTTLPSNPPFTPPAPYPAEMRGRSFWYGTDALWTALPVSGDWTSKGVGQKLFVWARGFDWHTEPKPFLIVTGKRVDGEAPPIAEAGGVTAGTGPTARMLIGVLFPTGGCWEMNVYHSGNVLTFVVSVAP